MSLRLDGQVESSGGRLVNTFEGIPDVPLSSFNLHINGGDGGLLQNTANLCEDTGALDGTFTAYNDKIAQATAPLELARRQLPAEGQEAEDVAGAVRARIGQARDDPEGPARIETPPRACSGACG